MQILDWTVPNVHNCPDSETEASREASRQRPILQFGMLEFVTSPTSRAVVLFAAIAMLITLGAYIASKYRGTDDSDRMTTNELLTNFRELHSKGELTDEEFRTIKSQLGRKLQKQLEDSDKPV